LGGGTAFIKRNSSGFSVLLTNPEYGRSVMNYDNSICPRSPKNTPLAVSGFTKLWAIHFRETLSSVDVIRWDEKAGLRRDAVGSQVIDALEAQEIKETGNEEG
jgi:hypothetical protein